MPQWGFCSGATPVTAGARQRSCNGRGGRLRGPSLRDGRSECYDLRVSLVSLAQRTILQPRPRPDSQVLSEDGPKVLEDTPKARSGDGRQAVSQALSRAAVSEPHSFPILELPLGPVFESFHPGGCFPLVEDSRPVPRATILGMMVLRPADTAWEPSLAAEDLDRSIAQVKDWCFAVDGVSGSWPIADGNAVDASRLALQYATVDAVMAGASTVAREGVEGGGKPGHLWQPYTPLGWPSLRAHHATLEKALAELRRDRQSQGLLSQRRYPAQIAITRGSPPRGQDRDILDARIFRGRHPDGSAIETWILTTEAGADRLGERARSKGLNLADRFLTCSPSDDAESLDMARVPELLRSQLDARLVEHDGGAISLGAFLAAGAVHQVNLTLMRRRSVRDVLRTTPRLEPDQREGILSSWKGRPRLFADGRDGPPGTLPADWRLFYGVAEDGPGAEALVLSFDTRRDR